VNKTAAGSADRLKAGMELKLRGITLTITTDKQTRDKWPTTTRRSMQQCLRQYTELHWRGAGQPTGYK